MSEYTPPICKTDLDLTIVDDLEPEPLKEVHFLYRSPGRVLTINDHWGPSIPYVSQARLGQSSNYGYRNIKGDAEAAADIPEAQGFPMIVDFLTRINATESRLATAGCEKALSNNDAYDPPLQYIGNYYSLLFAEDMENSLEEHIDLAINITNALSGSEEFWTTIELSIEASRSQLRAPIWVHHLKVMSHGEAENIRRNNLTVALNKIATMVEQEYVRHH